MATAYALTYRARTTALVTYVAGGGVQTSLRRRVNWNDSLVFTPGGSVETNDYSEVGPEHVTVPIGFRAFTDPAPIAWFYATTRSYLRPGWSPSTATGLCGIVELSYVDPDDVDGGAGQHLLLLRADVVRELSDSELEALADEYQAA